MKTYGDNKHLSGIERSKDYKDFQKLTQLVLERQWEDLIYSGLIVQIYDIFEKTFQTKFKKAASSDMRAQINQAILSGKVGNLDKLKRFITDKASGNLKTVGGFLGYGQAVKTYLYKIFNKGGQEALDKYLGTDKVKFNVSDALYKAKLSQRVTTLIKGLDATTKENIAKELIKGLENGENRKQLTKRLMSISKDLNRVRADRIARTETVSATEFMRHETAKMNGVEFKIWRCNFDERLCRICEPLHGLIAPIGEDFPGIGVPYPPSHINCRCYVEYDYAASSYKNYIKGGILDAEHESDLDWEKSSKPEVFYTPEKVPRSCCNPNAVWNGGKKLIGPDYIITEIQNGLVSERGYKEAYKAIQWKQFDALAEAVSTFSKESFYDMNEFRRRIELLSSTEMKLNLMGKTDVDLRWIAARAGLSEAGFIQLSRKLGFRGKVPKKYF